MILKRFDLGWLRLTSKFLNRTAFGLGILLLVTRTGMMKNTSVRARRFIADALRGFPFKGIGVSREKVRFKLVKGHQHKKTSIVACLFCCVLPSVEPIGVGKMRSSIRERFSLSVAKAPVRVINKKRRLIGDVLTYQ